MFFGLTIPLTGVHR